MRKWGRRLVFAIQFMTRYPISAQLYLQPDDFAAMSVFFPIVGLLVGAFSVLLAFVGNWTGSFLVSAVFAELGYIWITGAFHLDGLADTAETFFRRASPKEKLKIMKNPRIGWRGTIAIGIDIIASIVFIALLYQRYEVTEVYRCLLAVPVASRLGIVSACMISRSARSNGLGTPFINNITIWNFIFALIITFVLMTIIINWEIAVILSAINILVGMILATMIGWSLDGITGDTLGLINEVGQLVGLIVLFFLQLS